ncbi:hypothetical protein OHV13_32155 [Kitasatospora purpeofusca]|uniref:hypothetical protein n=1 Tax=Kitasatospora purpeofusca TaxID=67352 RepID=UPI00324C8782
MSADYWGTHVVGERTDIVLSAVVMSHPRRAARAEELCRAYPELGLTVVYDPEPDGVPSAWRTARHAWAAVTPGATHHLVLQDDLALAPDFAARLREAVAARPDDPLCLFAEWGSRTANAVRIAALHGFSWAPVVDDYIPCAALVLPAQAARGFDEYAASKSTESDPDDVVLLDYLAHLGMPAWAAVENLAQHDQVESLVGNSLMGLRRSVLFAGESALAPVTDSALTGLTAVPYYDWWSQQATLFVPDGSTVDGWAQLRSQPALRLWGVTPDEVEAEFAALLPLPSALTDRVNRILTAEIHKSGFLIGLVSGGLGPVADIAPGSTAAQALATLAPGGLRRVIPEQWLDTVAELLEPVVHAGVEAGLRRTPARRDS